MIRPAEPSRVLAALTALLLSLGLVAPAAAQAAGPHGLTEGHAAVIAQGVAPLPSASVAWVVGVGLADPATAAKAAVVPLGFTYAGDAALMVEDAADGRVRLLPGEAVFTRPGTQIRRIGIGRDPVPYLAIDLVAAKDAADARTAGASYAGAPIRSPGNGEFDVDLVRDVLRRGEATNLPAGVLPTLLHVVAGTVEIETGDGSPLRAAAGESVEVDGPAVLRGVGRGGATVLAALVSGEAPTRLIPPSAPGAAAPASPEAPAATPSLAATPEAPVLASPSAASPTASPAATPEAPGTAATPAVPATPEAPIAPETSIAPETPTVPAATPMGPAATPAGVGEQEGGGSIAMLARSCPIATEPQNLDQACLTPADGITFELEGPASQQGVTDDTGRLRFQMLPPGDYEVAAGVPGDFVDSYAICLDLDGNQLATRVDQNRFAVTVAGGVTCRWFMVPYNARGDTGGGNLSVVPLMCPPGATEEVFDPTLCVGNKAPDAGVPVEVRLLRGRGEPLPPAFASPEYFSWIGLPPGRYALVVGPLPPPLTGSLLAGQARAAADNAYQVNVTRDMTDATLILYLFQGGAGAGATPPAAPGATPFAPPPPATPTVTLPAAGSPPVSPRPAEPTATPPAAPNQGAMGPGAGRREGGRRGGGRGQRELTIVALACPSGSSPEVFDPEECGVAQIDFDPRLILARAAPIAPNERGPGFATWRDLPRGSYELDPGPLSPPYVAGNFAGQPRGAAGFRLRLGPRPGAAVLPLFLFPVEEPGATTVGPPPTTVPPAAVPPTVAAPTAIPPTAVPPAAAPPVAATAEAGATGSPIAPARDSDGDGLPDADEIALGTDPNNPDSDGDGLTDGFEALPPAATLDSDRDGLSDADEAALGTDPRNPDADGDGLLDGAEGTRFPTDPLLADTDGDGVPDGVQMTQTQGAEPAGAAQTNEAAFASGAFEAMGGGGVAAFTPADAAATPAGAAATVPEAAPAGRGGHGAPLKCQEPGWR